MVTKVVLSCILAFFYLEQRFGFVLYIKSDNGKEVFFKLLSSFQEKKKSITYYPDNLHALLSVVKKVLHQLLKLRKHTMHFKIYSDRHFISAKMVFKLLCILGCVLWIYIYIYVHICVHRYIHMYTHHPLSYQNIVSCFILILRWIFFLPSVNICLAIAHDMSWRQRKEIPALMLYKDINLEVQ